MEPFLRAFGVNPLFIYVLADVLAILLGVITVTYQGESTSLQQAFMPVPCNPFSETRGGH